MERRPAADTQPCSPSRYLPDFEPTWDARPKGQAQNFQRVAIIRERLVINLKIIKLCNMSVVVTATEKNQNRRDTEFKNEDCSFK